MTGRTRDYLADLANRKGISLPNFQDKNQAAASAKIEELLELPDKTFGELEAKTESAALKKIEKIIEGISQWTFAE